MADIDQIDVQTLTPQDWVRLAYILLLKRKVDKVGLAYWQGVIEQGQFSRRALFEGLFKSPEFLMVDRATFPEMIHRSRQTWVRTLAPFESVLDIGGSSPNVNSGALIELGYAHRPKEIVIFDLPEEQQYWGKPKHPQDRDYVFPWGRVTHHHGHVENIHEFKELDSNRYDCVFMGQTFEHIYPEKVGDVLDWIHSHLKNTGRFIFDTPNRGVTVVQAPFEYIDADHKYEYTPAEAKKLLEKHSFTVIRQTGLLNMPGSYRTKIFNPTEALDGELVCDSLDSSYLFAMECAPLHR